MSLSKRKKRKRKYDGWTLHYGLFEVFWKDGIGKRIRVCGAEYVPVRNRRAEKVPVVKL